MQAGYILTIMDEENCMNHFEKESLGLFLTPMYRLPQMSRELGTNVVLEKCRFFEI